MNIKKTYLAKLESVLFADELEVAADEDEHTAGRARGLAINGGDAVLALLEGKAGELGYDALGPLDLLTFENSPKGETEKSEVSANNSDLVFLDREENANPEFLRYHQSPENCPEPL
ncbi:hypothetical protein LOK49_LG10G00105 [Camellia lanceoleosa]|uniref:Uncharacterized protein n=1 Tax=Camellia lanceoleosa TaxID=1840588 RepID=A0ACC0G7B8_9ERIC|nr:hypothetical protein LOK49_LG10G00105 [Camellia lanceoleosa]